MDNFQSFIKGDVTMKPEEKARLAIDKKLTESGWIIQDVKSLNLSASFII